MIDLGLDISAFALLIVVVTVDENWKKLHGYNVFEKRRVSFFFPYRSRLGYGGLDLERERMELGRWTVTEWGSSLIWRF